MQILTWKKLLNEEKKKPYFISILNKIIEERMAKVVIYPKQKEIFNAFRLTEFHDVKVVILGQDPYHCPRQAHGLAFSVPPGVKIPPSLVNIYRELEYSIPDFVFPSHGYLVSWARQGVLLLNTVLTVRAGQARSHVGLNWEIFTNKVISLISQYLDKIVFLLWGSHAQKKEGIINKECHYVLRTSHPSPLSAHRGFFGCNHFSLTNKWLQENGRTPINWNPILYDTENKNTILSYFSG